MTALTKSEMAEKLYEELGLNKREAKEVVEHFFEEIRHSLEGFCSPTDLPSSDILTMLAGLMDEAVAPDGEINMSSSIRQLTLPEASSFN